MQKYVIKLPEKYKDILIMRYGEELKNKEIAVILHMSESTVATRIGRAKAMLRKMYEKDGGKHE
jgi:RNA polymerase sigma-70 factor (ECF subfamily)